MNKSAFIKVLLAIMAVSSISIASDDMESGVMHVKTIQVTQELEFNLPHVYINGDDGNSYDVILPEIAERMVVKKSNNGHRTFTTECTDKGYLTREARLLLLQNNDCLFIGDLNYKTVRFRKMHNGAVDIKSIKPVLVRDYFVAKTMREYSANGIWKMGLGSYFTYGYSDQVKEKLNSFMDMLIAKGSLPSKSLDVKDLYNEFIDLGQKLDVNSTQDPAFHPFLQLFLNYKFFKKGSIDSAEAEEMRAQNLSLKDDALEIIRQRSYTRFGEYVRNSRQYEFFVAFESQLSNLSNIL